ncbi:MAG: hypothetical protein AB7F59_01805 [Bdellovibrionales bacterium]
MGKIKLKVLPMLLAFTMLGACAERYREADPGRSAEEVEQFLSDIRTRGASGSQSAAALNLTKDQSSMIYFAESDNTGKAAMGPIHVVAPLSFEDLGIDIQPKDMEYLRIFFVENLNNGDREYALIIDVKKTGAQAQAFTFVHNATTAEVGSSVDDGVFEVTFPLSTQGNKALILRSDDTDADSELMDVIQMQFGVLSTENEEFSIGQVSSMVGFR